MPLIMGWLRYRRDDPGHAIANDQVIVSADSDFTALLALRGLRSPSLILLRSADHLTPSEQAALLGANLPSVAAELASGAVVSLTQNRLRVRLLPDEMTRRPCPIRAR
jgi:predicted nuclease of predicted toxin-antitoxin system